MSNRSGITNCATNPILVPKRANASGCDSPIENIASSDRWAGELAKYREVAYFVLDREEVALVIDRNNNSFLHDVIFATVRCVACRTTSELQDLQPYPLT